MSPPIFPPFASLELFGITVGMVVMWRDRYRRELDNPEYDLCLVTEMKEHTFWIFSSQDGHQEWWGKDEASDFFFVCDEKGKGVGER